ncbi:MAG: glycine cleavage system protein GcvH [Nitrospinota bacterium]|jgi:glycine cleavage system H protein|nr:glycine cleavage system protein GcvH [Nitrospinota bacterium]HJN02784.1 glycine cleavage system protein GcvH [Nitrospinota bacterium]
MEFPESLLYTKEHEWIKVEANEATVGITDYAQKELGDIVFVELPDVNEELEQSKRFGVVESVKTVSDLFSPLNGKVIEVNTSLEAEPELVNASPFENGWMLKLEIKNKEEIKTLLSAADYKKFVEEESG